MLGVIIIVVVRKPFRVMKPFEDLRKVMTFSLENNNVQMYTYKSSTRSQAQKKGKGLTKAPRLLCHPSFLLLTSLTGFSG